MNYKHKVQLEIISNKINDYFLNNPTSNGAIFETNFNGKKNKLYVEKKEGKLKITEAPAGKVLRQREAQLANTASQLQQQVAQIQQAQQAASQLQLPQPPQPPQPGPSMMPVSQASVDPSAMPPMPMGAPAIDPASAGMAPPIAPVQSISPVQPMVPMPPSAVDPNAMPPQPQMPPPAPAPEPQAVQAPPTPEEPPSGGGDWDVDTGEKARRALGKLGLRAGLQQIAANDPQEFSQELGASPQALLQNPMVPPDIAAGTEEPPEPEKEVMAPIQEVPFGNQPVNYNDMQKAYSDAITKVPFQPVQVGQAMQKITHGLGDLTSRDRNNAAAMLAVLAGTQEDQPDIQTAGSLSSINAGVSRKGKILKEDGLLKKKLADMAPFQPTTSEESALVRGLKGQVVRDVSLENDEDSVRLTLTLATTDWPVIIEFSESGKITYTFKDRRYMLQKNWNKEKNAVKRNL